MTSLLIQGSVSIATLMCVWLYGNKTIWGPIWGLITEATWVALVFYGQLWGLLPVPIVLGFAHGRNLLKWIKEQRACQPLGSGSA